MRNPQGYAEFYRRSVEDRDAFWTEQAGLVDWQKPFDRVCNEDNPSVCPLVRGWADQSVSQRGGPTPEGPG